MENNTQLLVKSLITLLGQSFSKVSMPLIEKACDAIGLDFNDDLSEILLDDNIEICGRINGKDWFDVTFDVRFGWHASTQVNSEVQNLTGYYDCKYAAFIQGVINLMGSTIEEDDYVPAPLLPEQIIFSESILTPEQGAQVASFAQQMRSITPFN
jgi:hypothetical protein